MCLLKSQSKAYFLSLDFKKKVASLAIVKVVIQIARK